MKLKEGYRFTTGTVGKKALSPLLISLKCEGSDLYSGLIAILQALSIDFLPVSYQASLSLS
jgi:hypothetical protein